MDEPFIFATAHFRQNPEATMEELRKTIEAELQGSMTGVVRIQISHGGSELSCLGCEKDDRREWTEAYEHTCGRA